MKSKFALMGLVAILSATVILIPTLTDDAFAIKSAGRPTLKYGSATDHLVCGGVLCSEANSIRVEEKTVKIEGLDVFYLEAGPSNAPNILLLHGFPTSSHMFRNLVPKLADEFHVVAPDYIGYGKSSMPSVSEFEYTFERQTQIIEQFTEKLKLDSYTLYVMDYGGPIGFRLFDNNPEKVKGFVIQNANAYDEGLEEFWDDWKVWWNDPTPENESKLHYLVAPETTKWQYTFGTRNPDAIDPDTWTTDQAGLDRSGNVAIQLAMAYDYRTNLPLYHQWQKSFREYQPPALIVWGGNDYIFPASGAHQYERDLDNVKKYILDTGHFVLEEDLEFVAKHMRAFVHSIQ
jgi:pimeloyl-ACP methyl ester carboxylesterase